MTIIDKKGLKLSCLLIFVLSIAGLSSGCLKQKTAGTGSDDWEKQVLFAQDCGMDGLPCCTKGDQPCFYNQQCCASPVDSKINMCREDCSCGTEGAFCCGEDQTCGDGLACLGGTCATCGGDNEPCCDKEQACQNDLVCHQNICVTCGLPGNPCCTIGESCMNQEKRDNTRTECRKGVCIFCGSSGQVSCEYPPFCENGHLLNNDFCYRCGGLNQPCCDDQSGVSDQCNPGKGLECDRGFCTQ